jgi:sugar O-acyltransferase (sialic acid O-acetyltransferase NeuD family)
VNNNVIVIGSGGHAKMVIDIMHEMKSVNIHGVTSNSLLQGSSFYGYKVLGNDDILKQFSRSNYHIAMGLGGYRDNILREKLYKYVKELGFNFINIIHPTAIISKTVVIGESVVIFPGAIINTDVQIGDNSIIATGSTIDHETIIGNNVLISAGVTIGANSLIMDNALLAIGSIVISGVKIGKNALVAAGAVVTKDVFDNEKVFGIPAKKRIENEFR